MRDSDWKCIDCGEVVDDHDPGLPGSKANPPLHDDCELPQQDVPTNGRTGRIDPPPKEW